MLKNVNWRFKPVDQSRPIRVEWSRRDEVAALDMVNARMTVRGDELPGASIPRDLVRDTRCVGGMVSVTAAAGSNVHVWVNRVMLPMELDHGTDEVWWVVAGEKVFVNRGSTEVAVIPGDRARWWVAVLRGRVLRVEVARMNHERVRRAYE